MVIFGGEARDSLGNAQGLGDTWALSLGGQPTWTQLAVGRPGPAPRVNPASCVDVTTRRMILVGGASPPGSDAWAFDLGADSAWAPLPTLPFNCVSCPLTRPARVLNMCAYDRVHNALMFYGDSLWMLTLSGTPQWRRIGGPPATSMIFDPVRNRLVFVVANSGRVDTEDLPRDMKDYGAGYYNGLLAAGYRPQQITDGPAVYDSARDRLLIVGGTYELTATRWAVSSATWALSFSGTPAWSSLNGDLGGPEPRTPPPLVAFDPIRNTLFLAGMRAEGSYDDREGRRAWLFSPDSQTWKVVADSATTTLGRVDDGVGVWDPVRGRTLVVNRRSGFFYGAGAVVTPPRVLGEPWLVISNGPPATAIDNCVYDPARDRLIELARDLQPSGRDGFQAWALPLNPPGTWTLLGSPLPVTGPVVVDEVGDRLVDPIGRGASGSRRRLGCLRPSAEPHAAPWLLG